MKVDLEEELKQTSARQNESVNEFNDLTEVKLLLEHNGQRERAVLRNFSLDDSLVRVEEERGKILEIEDFTKCYGNAYSLNTIKALALRYRMRFLPLNMYAGAIDPLLARKLLEFGEKHNIDVTHSGTQDMFYVLAPGEDFKLEKEVHKHIVRRVVLTDPLLFYRGDTDDNKNREGKLWTLVHKWGTDMSAWRAVKALPFRNGKALWVANTLAVWAVSFVVITLLFATYSFSPVTLLLISLLIGMVLSAIRSSNISESDAKNKFTEQNWSDSRYHVDEVEVITEYRPRFS